MLLCPLEGGTTAGSFNGIRTNQVRVGGSAYEILKCSLSLMLSSRSNMFLLAVRAIDPTKQLVQKAGIGFFYSFRVFISGFHVKGEKTKGSHYSVMDGGYAYDRYECRILKMCLPSHTAYIRILQVLCFPLPPTTTGKINWPGLRYVEQPLCTYV